MTIKELRELEASQIECRINTLSDAGLSLILYSNTRALMNILDQMYSPLNWQRKHFELDGSVYCSIEIWDKDKGQWVSKCDVGSAGDFQIEKSKSSDSFKRACVSVGIGRGLYTAPFLWIPSSKYEWEKTPKGIKVKDSFFVSHIAYNDKHEISELVIMNQKGVTVFEKKAKQVREKKSDMQITLKQFGELNTAMEIAGVSIQTVLENYGLKDISEMTPAIYQRAMRKLKITQKNAA